MPSCYYTCNLLPLDLVVRRGFSPRWLGNHLRDPNAPARREALSIHPMTCPYVTKLVAGADALFGGGPSERTGGVTEADCLVVPGGCDAMRRMGDLLAATYPDKVYVLPLPRSSGPEVERTLAADLARLDDWLGARAPADAARADTDEPAPVPQEPPTVEYPRAPRPGGVFLVAGPSSDDSLLRLVGQLGADVAGLESCTSPDRWKPLAAAGAVPLDYETMAAKLSEVGMCPRRSTVARREYLVGRLEETQPSSIIYARQSFCDPGAYDALLVAQLAEQRGLPYLEIEVDFPFDANGPLRTRVEAFLEAQQLDDDLLGDLDDDLFGDGAGDGSAHLDEED